MAQFDLFFTYLPPVTRLYLFSATTLMLLCTLDVLSPFSLYMNAHFAFHRWQVWRVVTCFLFFGNFSLPFFWNVGSIINVMTYVWGRRNPHTRLSVFFVSVQAPYLPFVLLLVSVLVGWNLADHLIGILVGHIYYFFEDIYPLLPTGKGRRVFRTPRLLLWLLNEPPE
ncbi:UNVERIFIED_CONTAM: hypothetical protein H355_016809 [Colinus virginianus]|nr:hypothetical protein H355_016809 [Colinus virginianus]